MKYVVEVIFLVSILFSNVAYSAIPNLERKPKETSSLANSTILSFSDWKHRKIRSAHTIYINNKTKYENSSQNSVFERKQIYQNLQRSHRVLEATRRLTVSDYFDIYIFPNFPSNTNTLEHALSGLNKSQVAELLLSYQKKLKNQGGL